MTEGFNSILQYKYKEILEQTSRTQMCSHLYKGKSGQEPLIYISTAKNNSPGTASIAEPLTAVSRTNPSLSAVRGSLHSTKPHKTTKTGWTENKGFWEILTVILKWEYCMRIWWCYIKNIHTKGKIMNLQLPNATTLQNMEDMLLVYTLW